MAGGRLCAVDPRTGVADRIAVSGARQLSAGDGLEVRGRTLYVDNGDGGDEVVVLRLSGDGRSATTTGVIAERRPEQPDRPTTAALVAGSLYVVNGRFSVAGPADRALRDARAQALSRAVTRTAECRRARSG